MISRICAISGRRGFLSRSAMLAALACATPARGAGLAPLADTTEGIHLGQAFNYRIPDPLSEVGKIDIVWAAEHPVPPSVYNTLYYPFDRNLAHRAGGMLRDLAWFKENHPDWIVYTCAAARYASQQVVPDAAIAWEFHDDGGWVPLDITNPAVLQFMFETYLAPAIKQGYQGIAFDNVGFRNDFNRCGVWQKGGWSKQYSGDKRGDPAIISAVTGWAAWMNPRLHAIGGSVVMNLSYDFSLANATATLDQLVGNADVILPEGGTETFGNGSEAAWRTNIEWLRHVQAGGKGLFLLNYIPGDSVVDKDVSHNVTWNLANYLLVKERHTYLESQTDWGREVSASLDWLRPEYNAPIGHPLGDMVQNGGVYLRGYSGGCALVNPSRTTGYRLEFSPGSYRELSGNAVDRVALGVQSAAVLLSAGTDQHGCRVTVVPAQ